MPPYVWMEIMMATTTEPAGAPTSPPKIAARPGEEVWETTTDGTVWLQFTDHTGRATQRAYGGKAGTRIRIREQDRIINQDACILGNDVFTNGMLVRIDEPKANSDNAMATAQLLKGFAKTGKAFESFVDGLAEINVRRMKAMAAEADATTSQTAYLDTTIKDKFRVEGDTPTYRSMNRGPQE